jgi:hypothetical protein
MNIRGCEPSCPQHNLTAIARACGSQSKIDRRITLAAGTLITCTRVRPERRNRWDVPRRPARRPPHRKFVTGWATPLRRGSPESGGHEGGVVAQLIYQHQRNVTEALVGTLIDTPIANLLQTFSWVCGQLTILYRPDSPHREDYLGCTLLPRRCITLYAHSRSSP